MQKVRKAVIPCAGFGTRFLPATKTIAKEMFPIVDTPTIQYIVEEAVNSGITDILLITSRRKKSLEDYFDREPELEQILIKENKTDFLRKLNYPNTIANISFVHQHEMKGTGNAILLAETFAAGEPIAVLFGDDLIYSPDNPVTKQLIEAYENTNMTVVGCQNVKDEDVKKYGIVNPGLTKGRYSEIKGFVEKPSIENAPSRLASFGRYVLSPAIFDYIKDVKPMKNGEIGLTDAILAEATNVGAYAYDFEGKHYDIGDKIGFISATIEYAMRDKELEPKLIEYLKSLNI